MTYDEGDDKFPMKSLKTFAEEENLKRYIYVSFEEACAVIRRLDSFAVQRIYSQGRKFKIGESTIFCPKHQ